jgi:anaphase-promoting complex subunit 5
VLIVKEQPLSASFERIVQAIGLYDHWSEVQQGGPVEAEQWAQHAVQAIVWTAAGELFHFMNMFINNGLDFARM